MPHYTFHNEIFPLFLFFLFNFTLFYFSGEVVRSEGGYEGAGKSMGLRYMLKTKYIKKFKYYRSINKDIQIIKNMSVWNVQKKLE